MKTPTTLQRIDQFFRDLIPTRIVTRHDPRSIRPAIAHTLTVDKAHDIIRSAENGQPEELFALYRDIMLSNSHLQGRFADRKRAVLGDTLSLQPFAKGNAADIAAKDALWPVTLLPEWIDFCNHLLDSGLWPVSVVEKVFRPSTQPGLAYDVAKLVPVPHELLDFTSGKLRIKDTDEAGRPLSTTHDADPHRYIIHRGHLLTAPDHWGGPLRSLIFWWLLGTMDREWWARFLDRYGAPFVVGKYESGDNDSRGVLERAFAYATKIGGLVVSRDTEVEIKQAAASDAGDAFEKFHALCNREISNLVVGQSLSSEAQPTGLGSGVANLQSEVRQDIRQFDALLLGRTLAVQLAAQFLQINGLQGKPPMFVWGSVSPAELKAWADMLTSLKTAGLRVGDEGIEALSERFGVPLERDESAGAGPILPFGASLGVRAFAASAHVQEDAIARAAAASLARSLGKHHAAIRQIILDAPSAQVAISRVEAYTATMDPSQAAKIVEEALIAYAANGSVAHAR